jgi:hypothetical protein
MLNSKPKLILILLLWWYSKGVLKAQSTQAELISLHGLHQKSKIDSSLIKYVKVALPYFGADLKGLKLLIRERKQLIPLTTVPAISNLWHSKKNWKVKINVSNGSAGKLNNILVKNMPDSASTGVIGHELSHAVDFYTHKPRYILQVFFWHLNPKKLDKFEFETDHLAIRKGFGHFLLAWSSTTHSRLDHQTFNRNKENNVYTERYMSPNTVKKYLLKYPEIYR